MQIREAKKKDSERIKAFADKHNLSFSVDSKILLAEDDNGEIKAAYGVRLIPMIVPFISDNSVMAKKLFDYVEEKFKAGGHPIVECFIEEKNRGLLEKLGFYEIFPTAIIMEKNFYSEAINENG